MRWLGTLLTLGLKELRVLRADPVLLLLMAYTFSVAVYTVANGARMEVRDAAIAIVDEDRSALSRALGAALLPPQFHPPLALTAAEVAPALDAGRIVFALFIPPRFEADLLAGRPATLGLELDATAMAMAGNGSAYVQQIAAAEVAERLGAGATPLSLVVRARFNPNGEATWFNAVMQVINSITILSIILPGAALLREREHGTLEHLLAMPVSALQIMLAKIGANALAIVGAAMLSLLLVVQGALGVPLAGSVPLFLGSALLFQMSLAALGILLATLTASTGQFGLLALPIVLLLMLLSGSMTPLESMPDWLRLLVQASPVTQFVAVAQAILYRGAGLDGVALRLLALLAQGCVFLGIALLGFRRALSRQG